MRVAFRSAAGFPAGSHAPDRPRRRAASVLLPNALVRGGSLPGLAFFHALGGYHDQASALKRQPVTWQGGRVRYTPVFRGRQGSAPSHTCAAGRPIRPTTTATRPTQDHQAQVGRPGRADGGHRHPQPGPGARARQAPARPISPSPRRWRRWRPARSAASSCPAPRSRPANPSASCPATWRTSSPPICGPLYDALSDRLSMKRVKALMAEGADRDRAGRLHARAHPEQRLRRHRRGPELHLRPAQDAADPPGLALDHGGHRRPAASPTCCPALSGLSDIAERLEAVADIAVVRLADRDIVRHPLVASMIGVL